MYKKDNSLAVVFFIHQEARNKVEPPSDESMQPISSRTSFNDRRLEGV